MTALGRPDGDAPAGRADASGPDRAAGAAGGEVPDVGRGADVAGREALEAAVTRLREDNEGLRRSLRHRGVIEQAKGVLMARTGGDPDAAFRKLLEHSQRTNQKLARVAAAVVTATITAREPVAPADDRDLDALFAVATAADGLRQADRRLGAAALDAARDLDELVGILATETAADLAPDAALLCAVEPDGAVRIVGNVGYDRQLMSSWLRMPPEVDVPLMTAVRAGRPVLLEDLDTCVRRFPLTGRILADFEAQACVPLRVRDQAVGVYALSWRQRRTFAAADEARLSELGEQLVGPLLRLLRTTEVGLPPPDAGVGARDWFRVALDAVLVPAFVLQPLRDDDGRVSDFRIDFVNRAALEAVGRDEPGELVRSTVLELYPRTASRRLFPTFLEVLATGEPAVVDEYLGEEELDGRRVHHRYTMAAARIGDALLVTWRRLDT
ncbi:GAF and ANTAR domain-containing protein [Egicoccus halophilus]|uniref:ANTAR domain-containing protein n=1 Tax=Egicoccus halophilus TaxID=1670830 RepID=A0A8J3AAJ8_9ACTN|nr:ANTAR domain-containing protein [Egicoccus halophilus]GGI06650.1 hypothetical protein GCM10011354_20150 [Egicoccus halophilus]